MSTLFYPKSFGRTRDFPSGGRKVYGWKTCSFQGDKCQPWCMQIKNPERSRDGALASILNRTSMRGTGTTSAGYPGSSLKP